MKARKAVFGGNSVAALKRAEVILISPDASENTLKEGKKLAAKLKCKAFVLILIIFPVILFCYLIGISNVLLYILALFQPVLINYFLFSDFY